MDFSEIKSKFNKVISYSQNIELVNSDDLFKDWKRNKEYFINCFGGELIYEFPNKISFELNEKEKAEKLNSFLQEGCFYSTKLYDFLKENKETFYQNKVKTNYIVGSAVIPAGMKLLKAFKFFNLSEIELRDVQDKCSRLIQENKVEGKLCLSVHPLDYLSISDNASNWRSCHALDGQHRSGNLSYMADSSTIIAYLKSDKEDEQITNFPPDVHWNNKKWRTLLFFSDTKDLLFAGRQYPFNVDSIINHIKNNVLPIVHLNEWTPWLEKKITSYEDGDFEVYFSDSYVPVGNKLRPIRDIVIDECELHYNDLLHSTVYSPKYAQKIKNSYYGRHTSVNSNTKVRIGSQVKCLKCSSSYITNPETVMCDECELRYGSLESDYYGLCPHCGGGFVYDDGWYITDVDEYWCPSCADFDSIDCEICGGKFSSSGVTYYEDECKYICNCCREERENN